MITKISINQVASYREPTVLEDAKPINLIYGLNGSGKTAISKFLRNPENESFSQCRIEKSSGDDFLIRVYNHEFVEDVFFNKDTQNGIFTLSKENKEVEQSWRVTSSSVLLAG
jgi:AAA15 family ATPase/GTPase